MDSWKRFNEASLSYKESFYSNLNMEDIPDVDHKHAIFWVIIDTLLPADVFENFRNMYIKVYELDPAHFLSVPGLVWQACLNKTEVELELITDLGMSLMVEKRITVGICNVILRYAKANSKYMKDYNKDEEESFLQYNDTNNLYGFAMLEPLPVDDFEWMEDLSKIDEVFIKYMMKIVMKDIYLK